MARGFNDFFIGFYDEKQEGHKMDILWSTIRRVRRKIVKKV